MRSKNPKVPKTRALRLRGKGDYTSDIKAMSKPLPRLEAKIDHLERSLVNATPKVSRAASSIGRTLGNFVNQGDLGALAGESLAKYFGHGDYKIKSNSLINAVTSNSGPVHPSFSRNGRRGTRIVEREFLTDIYSGALSSGSSIFSNTSYSIIPTNPDTFPWLSTIANSFDQWEPHGIVFEFVSTSSEFNGTSQALGTVILATEYDVTDLAFTTKVAMENADFACSTRPSENLLHGIECEPGERLTKILNTSANATTPALSNLATFQVATVGTSTANVRLGELWVSYDITLYKKQVPDPIIQIPTYQATATSTVGVGQYANLTIIASNLGMVMTQNVGVGSRLNFPPLQGDGYYFIYQVLTSTDLLNLAWNVLNNCVLVSERYQEVVGVSRVNVGVYRLTGPGAYVQSGLKLGAAGSIKIFATKCPPDMNVS